MAMIKIPEQKVILCGEYGAGKSSIFRRFTNDTFVTGTDRKSTLGLDHFQKVYQVIDRDIKVQQIGSCYEQFDNFGNFFDSFSFGTLVAWNE